MLKAALFGSFAVLSLASMPLVAQGVPAYVKGEMPSLLETYKGIHAHPELSHFEVNTSALLAADLRKDGYTVTEHVGVYPDGSKAYGGGGDPEEWRGADAAGAGGYGCAADRRRDGSAVCEQGDGEEQGRAGCGG